MPPEDGLVLLDDPQPENKSELRNMITTAEGPRGRLSRLKFKGSVTFVNLCSTQSVPDQRESAIQQRSGVRS